MDESTYEDVGRAELVARVSLDSVSDGHGKVPSSKKGRDGKDGGGLEGVGSAHGDDTEVEEHRENTTNDERRVDGVVVVEDRGREFSEVDASKDPVREAHDDDQVRGEVGRRGKPGPGVSSDSHVEELIGGRRG